MLDNLLDFTASRVGQGIPIKPREADLPLLAEHVVDELRAAHPRGKLYLELKGDGRGCFDPGRISQVYQNLIGNALQYGAGEEVWILVEGEHNHVKVSVHNEGTPIPPDEQIHIFDLFRRHASPGAGSRMCKNLGLGLYIAKEIVELHGGTIGVESDIGHGTTFKVLLPKRASAQKSRMAAAS